MNQKLVEKLKELTEIPSVSGDEGGVCSWLKKELKASADKIYVDQIGNLIAVRGQPQVVLFCHLDKIGWMISQISQDKVTAVPLKKGKGLPGKSCWPVVIGKDGLIKAFLTETDQIAHVLEIILEKKSLKKINVGDFVSLAPNFMGLGDNLISSQGLDNKLGVLAGAEIFKQSDDLAFVGTVREEAFSGGAKIAALGLKPKAATILDVTYDENPTKDYPIKIGQGPAICLKDDLLPDPKLVAGLVQTARKYHFPYQLEVLESGGSDASGLADLPFYLPFVFIGIPIKFMHTPAEIGSLDDLEKTISLLTNFIKKA